MSRRHKHNTAPSSTNPAKLAFFSFLFLILIGVYLSYTRSRSPKHLINTNYKGNNWRTDQTLKVRPVVATEFGSCELHTVKSEAGDVIEDWLWWDEKDQVNVLVHLAEPDRFLMLRQKKYGLVGESLATVGGLVESSETPLEAAKRELSEELGLQSEQWISLGKFRISSVRGGGYLNSFIALDSHATPGSENFKPSGDLEAQHSVHMNKENLMEAVMNGQIQEVKWTATVALGLEWFSQNRVVK